MLLMFPFKETLNIKYCFLQGRKETLYLFTSGNSFFRYFACVSCFSVCVFYRYVTSHFTLCKLIAMSKIIKETSLNVTMPVHRSQKKVEKENVKQVVQ